MRAQNAESWFLTKMDEERFAEGLRKTLISDYSNPGREGCPDPKTIRALAFHKRIGDPESFERITNHMAECSACVRDALSYAEEYKDITNRRRAVSLAFALVATLVLSAALWAIWRTQSHEPPIAKSPAMPNQAMPPQVIADAGARTTKPAAIPRFTPVAIELPLSWRGASPSERPLVLPRGHLQLEIRLPIGSPNGAYRLRISDGSGRVRITAEVTSRTVDNKATLHVTLNLSDVSRGQYSLSLLEPGIGEWTDYVVLVK